ncbi:uncharacterized protein [Lepisosteus oculatus]|uniref:uncharacterized protein isoform X2 n=1 Tax=Lepisosteus oculatus TaxID=7918 RepID=UPI0035F526BA
MDAPAAARIALVFLTYVCTTRGLGAEPAAVVELRVRAGDTVTLPCGIRHLKETLWMIQRPLEVPLIAAVGQVSGSQVNKEVEEGYRSCLSLVLEPSTLSVSLTLANLTESDRALYYCADRVGGRLSFGNGMELVFPGGGLERSPPVHLQLSCLLVLLSALPLSALVSSYCAYCLFARDGTAARPCWTGPCPAQCTVNHDWTSRTRNRDPTCESWCSFCQLLCPDLPNLLLQRLLIAPELCVACRKRSRARRQPSILAATANQTQYENVDVTVPPADPGTETSAGRDPSSLSSGLQSGRK